MHTRWISIVLACWELLVFAKYLSDRLRQKCLKMRLCVSVLFILWFVTLADFLPHSLAGVTLEINNRRHNENEIMKSTVTLNKIKFLSKEKCSTNSWLHTGFRPWYPKQKSLFWGHSTTTSFSECGLCSYLYCVTWWYVQKAD